MNALTPVKPNHQHQQATPSLVEHDAVQARVAAVQAGRVSVRHNIELTMDDLCHTCAVPPDAIIELVTHGVFKNAVMHQNQPPEHWRFDAGQLQRAKVAICLQRGLEIKPAEVVLALQILDELDQTRSTLNQD